MAHFASLPLRALLRLAAAAEPAAPSLQALADLSTSTSLSSATHQPRTSAAGAASSRRAGATRDAAASGERSRADRTAAAASGASKPQSSGVVPRGAWKEAFAPPDEYGLWALQSQRAARPAAQRPGEAPAGRSPLRSAESPAAARKWARNRVAAVAELALEPLEPLDATGAAPPAAEQDSQLTRGPAAAAAEAEGSSWSPRIEGRAAAAEGAAGRGARTPQRAPSAAEPLASIAPQLDADWDNDSEAAEAKFGGVVDSGALAAKSCSELSALPPCSHPHLAAVVVGWCICETLLEFVHA